MGIKGIVVVIGSGSGSGSFSLWRRLGFVDVLFLYMGSNIQWKMENGNGEYHFNGEGEEIGYEVHMLYASAIGRALGIITLCH